MWKDLIFYLLGGLGIFLYGMKMLSESLQMIAGDRMRKVIAAVTDNRVLGVGTGLLVTMVVQSSSVTTVMVVSFINAGVMKLAQGASVVLGANIGTTITGWILVLKLHKFALPIMGVGVFMHLFSDREKPKYLGQLAMGFGMIFFGLKLMEEGFAPLKEHPEFSHIMAYFGAGGFGNLLMSVLVGATLTMIVQSSSAMLGVTIALATVGLIDFRGASGLILGENIGTTITAQLAAIGATTDSRRAAMFHSFVNVVGVLVMLGLFPYWVHAVDSIMPGDPNALDASGSRAHITAHISMAHTSFNVVMVCIATPLLHQIVNIVKRLVPDRQKVHTSLKFLHFNMLEAPALAIEQGRQEVFHMAGIARDMLEMTRELYKDITNANIGLKDKILRLEKITDVIQHEITVFMSRVMSGALTVAQSNEVRMIIRLADEIESVGDYCERLANYRARAIKDGAQFSAVALKDVQDYLESTTQFYDEILAHAKSGETGWKPDIQTKGNHLMEVADGIRAAHLKRLEAKECDPTAGIIFSDMIVALRRIRNHSYNMAEAFLGEK